MEHSPMYSKIHWYFKQGLWTIDMVRKAVEKGKITAAEFKEITGQDY